MNENDLNKVDVGSGGEMEVLDVPGCAKLILKSENTVRSYIRKGVIPYYKREGAIYFLKSEILNWIKDGRKQ